MSEEIRLDPVITEAMAFASDVRLEALKLLVRCRSLGPWGQGGSVYDVYSFDGTTSINKVTNTGIMRNAHESPGEALGALIMNRATRNTLNRRNAAEEVPS